MKVSLRPMGRRSLRQYLRRWSGRPWVEVALRSLLCLAVGFLLAGVQAGGEFLPLSLSFSAALGLGLRSFAAYFGGCLGYAAFFGFDMAMEPMAAGLLVEACLCIFGDQLPDENRWFAPCVTMVFSAVVGFLFLLQSRFPVRLLGRYVLRIAVAGLGTVCLRMAMEPAGQKARTIVLAALCGGLCAVTPFGFPLGLIAACAVAAAAAETTMGLLTAVLCGLAMDLCWSSGTTGVLVLAVLGSGVVANRYLRLVVWYILLTVGVLLLDTPLLLLLGGLFGGALSLLLPVDRLFGQLPRKLGAADPRMALVSGLLGQIGSCLSVMRSDRPDPETNAVFDQAAERVCRLCSRWETCWESELEGTCEALNRAAPAMMTRGKALRDDLPPAFADRCRHLEGFLTAINRELEDLSCRRQYRRRLLESRTVLAQQYRILSEALACRRPELPPPFRFQPELGFRSQGRKAQTVSGDRGVSFRVGQWFYLLLCDGILLKLVGFSDDVS